MKTQIILLIGLLFFYLGNVNNNFIAAQETQSSETLRIVSVPEFSSLTDYWAEEFSKLHPESDVEVITLTKENRFSPLSTEADLYLVSKETYASLKNKGLWKMVVGKDALIPVMNSKNPFLPKIKKHNLSMEILAQIPTSKTERFWYDFPKTGKNELINYYEVDDPIQKSMIANFLSTEKNIECLDVENCDKLVTAINADPYSIGFCRLSTLINSNLDDNITIMPVDLNGNNKIDDFENIYTNLQTFLSKRWYEKTPKKLTESIYVISSQTPTNNGKLDFLKFITTDGQKILDRMGYATLLYKEKQANLKQLGYQVDIVAATEDSPPYPYMPYILTGIFVLIVLGLMVASVPKKKDANVNNPGNSPILLNENSLNVPSGLYFDKTHTWAFMNKDGTVKVGIDDFLQHTTGSITKVSLKNTGEPVKKGEHILSVFQHGKMLNIYSPVSGTIKETNKGLVENPSLINTSTYSDGWVYTIEPNNWEREIQFLIIGKVFKDWLKSEFIRLKDFLSISMKEHEMQYAHVLQDGGAIMDGVLENLEPEIWEDFQTNFIDTYR